MNDLEQALQMVTKPRTVKKRAAVSVLLPEHKKRYIDAHREHSKRVYPLVYSDGHYTPPVIPKVSTSNGLTRFIVNFLVWTKHHGERTGNSGRVIDNRKTYTDVVGRTRVIGSTKYIPGSGKNGTSDIKGHIMNHKYKFPIPIYVEIKIEGDTQSDDQKDYEKQVTDTGALYLLAATPADWFRFYDYVMAL